MLTTWTALPMLDRLFDDVMYGGRGTALGTASSNRTFSPAIDVRANADDITFVCDVPGFKQTDLDVSVEGNTLTIKGHRRYEGTDKDQVWLGRSYGAFEKSFTLPDLTETDQLTAHLQDGVLTVRIPKKAQAKPRRIQIGVGDQKRLEE